MEIVLTKLSTVSSNSDEGLSATELALVKGGVGALVNHSNKRRDTGQVPDERSLDDDHLSDKDKFGKTKVIPNTSRLSILTI